MAGCGITTDSHVEIHASEILAREEDGVALAKREVALAKPALVWELRTLALDGDQDGLRRPAFG